MIFISAFRIAHQNQHLEALLREREQERDRLREMLERDTGDQAMAGGKTGAAYLPPGLPSKVCVCVCVRACVCVCVSV